MNHQYWRAIVTLKDDTHEWDVIIWSMYQDKKAATRGAEAFTKHTAPAHGYNVVRWRVEPTPSKQEVI